MTPRSNFDIKSILARRTEEPSTHADRGLNESFISVFGVSFYDSAYGID